MQLQIHKNGQLYIGFTTGMGCMNLHYMTTFLPRSTWLTPSNMDCNRVLLQQSSFSHTSQPLFCSSVAGGWPNLAEDSRYGQVQCTHDGPITTNNFIMLHFFSFRLTIYPTVLSPYECHVAVRMFLGFPKPIRCPDLESDKWRKCYITSGKKLPSDLIGIGVWGGWFKCDCQSRDDEGGFLANFLSAKMMATMMKFLQFPFEIVSSPP